MDKTPEKQTPNNNKGIETLPFEHFETRVAGNLQNAGEEIWAVAEQNRKLIRSLWNIMAMDIQQNGTEVVLVTQEETFRMLAPFIQDAVANLENDAFTWLFREHSEKKAFIIKFMHMTMKIPLCDIFEITQTENWNDEDIVKACFAAGIPPEAILKTCLINDWSKEEIESAFKSCGVDLTQ